MSETHNPISGQELGIHELSDRELMEGGVDLSKRGPRIEISQKNPEIKAELQSLLEQYREKMVQGVRKENNDNKFQAPEVRDPYFYEAQYGSEFISQLLTDGHVDTYDFTRRIGRGLNMNAFGNLMQKIERILDIQDKAA